MCSSWIKRRSRWFRLLVLHAALLVQLPLTLINLPRLGTARYVSEVGTGISRAYAEAWRGW